MTAAAGLRRDPAAATSSPSGGTGRIAALDQFRGYTVVGMIAVNYLGRFQAIHPILKHHNTYCSYADTIMPQFLFAVGFAYRLTFLKRRDREGAGSAYRHALVRALGLLLLGLVFHGVDSGPARWSDLRDLGPGGVALRAFQREPFQALTHIAVTSIWILPVIGASALVRIVFLLASAALHLGLSDAFYLDFAWTRPVIDGGPLGFLSWTIPALVGSLAYDLLAARGPLRSLTPLVGWGAALMALAYALACLGLRGLVEPPFVAPPPDRDVDLWTMSQRTGSVTYLTFSAGFSLAVLALFVLLTDLGGLQVGLFRTFGTNALAAYLIHPMVGDFVNRYAPRDAPLPYVLAAFALYLGLCYTFVRYLERRAIYLRL